MVGYGLEIEREKSRVLNTTWQRSWRDWRDWGLQFPMDNGTLITP